MPSWTPGTVCSRPSKEAVIWNSWKRHKADDEKYFTLRQIFVTLKRQAMTAAVVARDSPTWSLMITGVTILATGGKGKYLIMY